MTNQLVLVNFWKILHMETLSLSVSWLAGNLCIQAGEAVYRLHP